MMMEVITDNVCNPSVSGDSKVIVWTKPGKQIYYGSVSEDAIPFASMLATARQWVALATSLGD